MSRILEGQGLVGRDLSRFAEAPRRRVPAGVIVGVLLAAFLLTYLRVNILHLGYAQGEALKEEQRLQEEHRVLSAQVVGREAADGPDSRPAERELRFSPSKLDHPPVIRNELPEAAIVAVARPGVHQQGEPHGPRHEQSDRRVGGEAQQPH